MTKVMCIVLHTNSLYGGPVVHFGYHCFSLNKAQL